MQRVQAHTSSIGSSLLSGEAYKAYRVLGDPPSNWINLYGIYRSARSYKSATIDGGSVGGFRKATNYVRLIAKHTSNVEPHFQKKRSLTSGGYTWEYRSDDSRTFISPNFASCPYVNWTSGSVDVGNIANRAWAECRNKVADQKIDVGVALGESIQTINMISTRIISLVHFANAIKAKKWKKAYDSLFGRGVPKPRKKYRAPKWARGKTPPGRKPKRSTGPVKDAADAWLEYWYGWYPLVMDIFGLCELLNEGLKKQDQLFRVTRLVTESTPARPFFGSETGIESSGTFDISAKATIWFKVVSSIHALSELGLINPLSVAWELTTLSFVIDWLIPVGDWLQSLTSMAGTVTVDAHCVHAVSGSAHAWHKNPGTGVAPLGILPSTQLQLMCMHRRVYSSAPIPLPYMRNPMSTKHLVTATALLAQRR